MAGLRPLHSRASRAASSAFVILAVATLLAIWFTRQKLGVFDVNTFFPEKDRFGLAMLLNNILAAPAFQTWIEGQPLDIPSLLYAEDGRPRHSMFYIAHLSDTERMFFVTLLFSAVEAWMRTQSGTTSLRALVY